MEVKLIRYTPEPRDLCELAAGLCYDAKNPARALSSAVEGGHLSVVEHASYSFLVSGVSRALLAQLTRHRIASFSVQSQRYVSLENKFEYVVPKGIEELGAAQVLEFRRQMEQIHKWYCQWQIKLGGALEKANEDARFVLPNATATNLLVTMNTRELLHFFELRTCNRAQWEIRRLADEMLKLCKQVDSELFKDAGCGCVNGRCPEGRRSCGKPRKASEWETADDNPRE